jgi:shikimate kinase (EC 2.7.1.71)
MRDINRLLLRRRGPVIVLSASPETIYRRTRRHKRPLLEIGNPTERIRELMNAREAAYQASADLNVSTDGRYSRDVVEEIVQKLWHWREQNLPAPQESERV